MMTRITSTVFSLMIYCRKDGILEIVSHLSYNIRQLREARSITQQQAASLAGIPRPTWASLETPGANPTLNTLTKVSAALQVSLVELLRAPRAACTYYPAGSLPSRGRSGVSVAELIPDSVVGIEIERLCLAKGRGMKGAPHTPGTKEYLICEKGSIQLAAAGEVLRLRKGDVVSFRGDQKHSYRNIGQGEAIAYCVIAVVPG